eukprot:3148005-Prorocentrum_lima.AAC.1
MGWCEWSHGLSARCSLRASATRSSAVAQWCSHHMRCTCTGTSRPASSARMRRRCRLRTMK